MSYTEALKNIKAELEQPLKDNVVLDPDGEGTVTLPVALYFQVLGLITWLGNTEDADGNDPS